MTTAAGHRGVATLTSDDYGDDDTAVDLMLFKVLGLLRLLKPGAAVRRARTTYLWITYMAVVVQLTQVVGLYTSTNDMSRFASMAVLAFNGLMCTFKGIVLVSNADRLWSVLDLARYRFTTCAHRRPADMRLTGAVVSTLLRTFATISYCTLVLWVVTPLLTNNGAYVTIVKQDGTPGAYRATINNIWLPGMSEELYNWTPVWVTIFGIEIAMLAVNVVSWMMIDCYIITVCFIFNAQFRTLSAGYETIGDQTPPKGSGVLGRGPDDGPVANSGKSTIHLLIILNALSSSQTFDRIIRLRVVVVSR